MIYNFYRSEMRSSYITLECNYNIIYKGKEWKRVRLENKNKKSKGKEKLCHAPDFEIFLPSGVQESHGGHECQ